MANAEIEDEFPELDGNWERIEISNSPQAIARQFAIESYGVVRVETTDSGILIRPFRGYSPCVLRQEFKYILESDPKAEIAIY